MSIRIDLSLLPVREPLWVNVLRWGLIGAVTDRTRPYRVTLYCNPVADCGYGIGMVSVLASGWEWERLTDTAEFLKSEEVDMVLSRIDIVASRIAETCGLTDESRVTSGVILGSVRFGCATIALTVKTRSDTRIVFEADDPGSEWDPLELFIPGPGHCFERTRGNRINTHADIIACNSNADVFYDSKDYVNYPTSFCR